MYNYAVDYVISAEEGIEYLKENPNTDVILLDINLGSGYSGTEALSVIKSTFKYVQVIMFTSMNTLEIGLECMKKGAFDYITKPYDETELLQKIVTALERKRNEQMNDLYLGIIVHDLKNPLQSIVGAVEYLKMSYEATLTDQQRKFIASAEKGINLIKIMINNILSISKFENGTLVARRESFNVKPHIESSLELFNLDASFQHKKLITRISIADDYILYTDKEFFLQILVNIVSNAIRYTSQEGTVEVTVTLEHADTVHVKVSNTGSYIEEPERAMIFNKFTRVQTAAGASRSGQNFGLGLTYCKMAVDAMGGEIWVEGNKDIPETTFHYTIQNQKDS